MLVGCVLCCTDSKMYNDSSHFMNDTEPPVVMASKAVVVTIAGDADDQTYIPAGEVTLTTEVTSTESVIGIQWSVCVLVVRGV